jgi:hypothetical protein
MLMSSTTEGSKQAASSARKEAPIARRRCKPTAFFFNNTIRSQGSCGPGYDRSGFKQYLINKDDQHRYRVTVVSTWINSLTNQLESYTKIYSSEAGGEIYLGCDYQHMTGNGETRITRKITREVKIDD